MGRSGTPGQSLKLGKKQGLSPDAFRGPLSLGWRGWLPLGSWLSLQGRHMISQAPSLPHLLGKEGRPLLPGLVKRMQTLCPKQLPCLNRPLREGGNLLDFAGSRISASRAVTAAATFWSLTLEEASATRLSLPPPCRLGPCSFRCVAAFSLIPGVGGMTGKLRCSSPSP